MTDRTPGARWLDRPGWRAAATAGPALLLVAVSLWEIVAVARSVVRMPPGREWRELSAALHARHRPGELILFAPAWMDPIGRFYLGDRISLDMAGRMDAVRYAVLWEVAEDGARAPETAGLSPVTSQAFGRLELRRYEQAPVAVVTDFAAALPGAAVSGRGKRPVAGLEEVGFAPRRCVLLVPEPDQTMRVRYGAVELGRELVGYVGLADVFTRRDVREPARLVVSIDGRPAAEVTVGVDDGWVRFAAPTEPRAGAVVEFAATALGRGARDRRVCFAAEARR